MVEPQMHTFTRLRSVTTTRVTIFYSDDGTSETHSTHSCLRG